MHSDYGPIPIAFYKSVLEKTNLKPVFMGQLSSDYYSALLVKSFPKARFIASQGAMRDFSALRKAKNLALSISTFSWLGGWLSEANKIHLPVYGVFNPLQRADAWFLPHEDERYIFYRMPLRKWSASDIQIQQLSDDYDIGTYSSNEIAELLRKRNLMIKNINLKSNINLFIRSLIYYPLTFSID